MKPKGLLIGTAVTVSTFFLGLILSIVLLFGPTLSAADRGPAVSVVIDGNNKVEGYTQEQPKNAAAITGAGKALDLSVNGQSVSPLSLKDYWFRQSPRFWS